LPHSAPISLSLISSPEWYLVGSADTPKVSLLWRSGGAYLVKAPWALCRRWRRFWWGLPCQTCRRWWRRQTGTPWSSRLGVGRGASNPIP
jgi:hypothetical protein